jgi:hypothetical protein
LENSAEDGRIILKWKLENMGQVGFDWFGKLSCDGSCKHVNEPCFDKICEIS